MSGFGPRVAADGKKQCCNKTVFMRCRGCPHSTVTIDDPENGGSPPGAWAEALAARPAPSGKPANHLASIAHSLERIATVLERLV